MTVLFSDVRGFTELTRRRGAEYVRPLIERMYERCRDIVISHDGIIDRFLGDAVLALFNVPIHHEDHVARAVGAAMDIQKAIQEENAQAPAGDMFQVGIGITTGAAVTGAVGSMRCEDYTAIGDVVNVASRLQGHAAAGEILLSEEAYKLVIDQFPGAEERTLQLKGLEDPVTAYALQPPA